MKDVIIFINKMKAVFSILPDEEIDTYNDLYNESTEKFIAWINRKYDEYYPKEKFDKIKNFWYNIIVRKK